MRTADCCCVAGLGTLVGDAVEMGAVMETVAAAAVRKHRPLLTGSYKPNTGHTYTGMHPTLHGTQ